MGKSQKEEGCNGNDRDGPKIFTKFPPCFSKHKGSCQRGNPGNVEELHLLARQIMPNFIDGLEMDYTHRIAINRFITANWLYSTTRPSGFRFGGIYTMRVQDNSIMRTPTIQGDINPSTLASNVNILYYPLKCLRFESNLQRKSEDSPLISKMTLELLRPCSTLTASLYEASRDSGRGTLSFLRAMTDRWALGAELLLEWTDPGMLSAETAFATRYSADYYTVAATASRRGVDISYYQKLHRNVQMASIIAYNHKNAKAIASVGYQWNFEDSRVRGLFNSDFSIGFLYLRQLQYVPCEMGISLFISLPTSRFIFGLKFNVNPSGLRRDIQMLENNTK